MLNRKRWAITGLALVIVLIATYWNHFDNGFYFDDIHTIVNNEYIRSLSHIPEYFTNIETFGTMPTNRGYRPMVTLLNAVDYRLAGNELNPVVFHVSIFAAYLIQGLLMFIMLLWLFRKVKPEVSMEGVALFTTAFYMFHTANAETINYIISRSDAFSTLCIVASMVLFQHRAARKRLLYLIPMTVGLFTKEVTAMVVPLMGLYHFLFEENGTLPELKSMEGRQKLWRSVRASLPALAVGLGITVLNLGFMTDTSRISGGLAHPRMDYFTSQFIVVAHYIGNFILPIDLSADPDFKVTPEIFTSKKIYSFTVIALLHGIALYCAFKRELTPIAFGILWFFITLAPTSTLNPLYQVSNDHRTFLPYIGLCIAVGWSIHLLYLKLESTSLRKALFGICILVMAGHAYGIQQRNEVWGSSELLWQDAVQKGPTNGRALMNYGLIKMQKGEYQEAEKYFRKALEILPYWTYTHINMAVLLDATGRPDEAENFYAQGLRFGRDNPEPYYYYAKSALSKGDLQKASDLLEQGHQVSPKHVKINTLRKQLKASGASPEEQLQQQQRLVKEQPTADNYINLSLMQYKRKDFEGCIRSCQNALKLNPQSHIAYNNICSAYNAIQQWALAAEACRKALQIQPEFERAKNNLRWAERELSGK